MQRRFTKARARGKKLAVLVAQKQAAAIAVRNASAAPMSKLSE
jgi:hypothetical protein